MCTKKKAIWISETEAASLMGFKPKVLRRYCQEGKLSISYTKLNRHTIEYNKLDIDKHKNDNAVWVLSM